MDYVSSISGLSFIDLDLDPEELGGYITWIPPGFLGSMGVKLLVPLIGGISPQWAISDSDSDHIYIYIPLIYLLYVLIVLAFVLGGLYATYRSHLL